MNTIFGESILACSKPEDSLKWMEALEKNDNSLLDSEFIGREKSSVNYK